MLLMLKLIRPYSPLLRFGSPKKIALMTMQTRNKYKVIKVDGVELLGKKFTKS